MTQRAIRSGFVLTLFSALTFAGVSLPQPAAAFECENQGAGASNSDDSGDASNMACGTDAEAGTAGNQDNTAVGNQAEAGATTDTTLNTALGQGASAEGGSATALGAGADAEASGVAVGQAADASSQAVAAGQGSSASGQAVAVGEDASASGDAVALGHDASASGDAVALGQGASASGDATALGQGASASGDAVAVGDAASASGDSTAVGHSASATFSRSAAFGADAAATRANQMVYGTSTETHTMPGITSAASRSAQSGPLELVTSDAAGNLATDRGETWQHIRRNKGKIEDNSEGVAMAMALADPDLVGEERLGLKVGWGTFDGEHAMGVTAAGVVLPDIGAGIRLGVAGGAAFGLREGNTGGRAGFQLTW